MCCTSCQPRSQHMLTARRWHAWCSCWRVCLRTKGARHSIDSSCACSRTSFDSTLKSTSWRLFHVVYAMQLMLICVSAACMTRQLGAGQRPICAPALTRHSSSVFQSRNAKLKSHLLYDNLLAGRWMTSCWRCGAAWQAWQQTRARRCCWRCMQAQWTCC